MEFRLFIIGLLSSGLALLDGVTGQAETYSVLPLPVEESESNLLRTNSPFTRTLLLSESLILTGIADVDGSPVATVIDTEAAESIAVSERPTSRGWRLVELSGTHDIESAVAVITVESGESFKVRYDKDRMKAASQRMRFAAKARSQQARAQTGTRIGRGRHGVPAERVEMLERIDRNELPQGYNPGAGKNREDSHRIHQSYVDRRLGGMSNRQRGVVGRLWNQKQTVDPGMSNRGAAFIRILEHVAENEPR